MSLNSSQVALGRSRLYTILGRLFLEGLSEESHPLVAAIPELAAVLPDPFIADEAAADHQGLFGFNVYPYQSVFLDSSGLLGGSVTDSVIHSYRNNGFVGWEGGENADHLGHELAHLAFLCGAEHDAWEDGIAAVAHRMANRQKDFLDLHLLPWLPPLVLAIRRQKQPFYTALADLAWTFVGSHRSDLGAGATPAFALPRPPNLLEDEKSGLKEIATHLLTPVYSGIYLSRDDIGRLAGRQKLPRGFGGRQQMLLNLLRSAATYEALDILLDSLIEMASSWAADYGAMSFAGPWERQASATLSLLGEMAAKVARAEPIE